MHHGNRSPPFATVGYWGVGFAGGCLPAFPALGFDPVELWWGLALGLVAVAVLLIPRLDPDGAPSSPTRSQRSRCTERGASRAVQAWR